MISPDYIRTLFDYNDWATSRLLNVAAQLAPEQLHAAPLSGHGSLWSTLVHTLGAMIIWRTRWEGESPSQMLSPAEMPSFAALRDRWAIEDATWQARLATLDDAALAAPLAYRNTQGVSLGEPLWQILTHLVNHGTQHRSEIAAMMTILGHSPGDLDMIKFFRQRNG
jgi:uncharacterized damage-inducible protein DinB